MQIPERHLCEMDVVAFPWAAAPQCPPPPPIYMMAEMFHHFHVLQII
jgi:hypothetical protein